MLRYTDIPDPVLNYECEKLSDIHVSDWQEDFPTKKIKPCSITVESDGLHSTSEVVLNSRYFSGKI